jgi:hypothetical protein
MLLDPPARPVRYTPDLEHPEKDEAETTQALTETMLKISEKTYEDGGHAIRSVHAKSHGLLRGEIEIAADLPPVLAQGLFAKSGRHPVVMRFSTIPGDILDDSVSTPRGLALKIFDVEGERLPDADGATQDFVMVNGKVFNAPNNKVFLNNLKLLAATTDKAEGAKKVLSAVNRGLETIIEAFGGESATLKSMGGQPETHILGDSFYTQVPILYGDYIAKLSVVPASPELTALTDAPLNVNGKPDGLREAVVEHFRTKGGVWDVRVQLCTDIEEMPVENAHKAWPEDKSPFLPVATITIGPQEAWSEALSEAVDDRMSFSPWHGITAHRPLGAVMRARRSAYKASAEFRGARNGCPMQEPRTFDETGL